MIFNLNKTQVWSLEKPDWTCKIDEGLAGLAAVRWSPDGRHILSTADFQVCFSLWNLYRKIFSGGDISNEIVVLFLSFLAENFSLVSD